LFPANSSRYGRFCADQNRSRSFLVSICLKYTFGHLKVGQVLERLEFRLSVRCPYDRFRYLLVRCGHHVIEMVWVCGMVPKVVHKTQERHKLFKRLRCSEQLWLQQFFALSYSSRSCPCHDLQKSLC